VNNTAATVNESETRIWYRSYCGPCLCWKKSHMHVMFREVVISSIPQGVYCTTLQHLKVHLWKLRLEMAKSVVNCWYFSGLYTSLQ